MVFRCMAPLLPVLLVVVVSCIGFLPSVRGSCCCEELDGAELYDVLWCNASVDASVVFYWTGVPTSGSLGSCLNWIDAGDRGDHEEKTIAAINADYNTNFSDCQEFVGTASNDCNAAQAAFIGAGLDATCTRPESKLNGGGKPQAHICMWTTIGAAFVGFAISVF